jgi:hypothetical protein
MDWLILGRAMSFVEISGAGLIFLTNVTIVSLRLFKIIN